MASNFQSRALLEREGIQFPKRLIIANFTHGTIIVNKDETEKTFVVPPDIKIKRAWASVPGVCNFVSYDTNALFANNIINAKERLETIPFEAVDAEFNVFLDKFKTVDKETLQQMNRIVKEKFNILELGDEEDIENLKRATDYVHNFDKFFQLSTYLPGDTVIDKLFTRTNSEVLNKSRKREWVMLLVNVEPGNIDLITLMRTQTRYGTIDIFFSDIIDYLRSKDVEEIIFFDNSCSNFLTEDEYAITNEREIRARRRALLNPSSSVKFGGKKGKKSYKKRKTNKKNKKSKKRRL